MGDIAVAVRTEPAVVAHRRESWRAAALLAGLVVAVYSPVVIAAYGFSDDYLILDLARSHPGKLVHIDLSNGRPIFVPIHLLFAQVPDVDALRWLRLVTILGIAAVAVATNRVLGSFGWSRVRSFLTALTVAVLPCWQVVASWATLVVAPLVALAAMWAAVLTLRGGARSVFAAIGVTIAALLTFQPAAMAYWPVITAGILTHPGRVRALWPRVLTVAGMSAIVAVVALRVGVEIEQVAGPRTRLTTDPVGKAGWFLTDALPRALDPLILRPFPAVPAVAAVVGVLLAVGMWRAGRWHLPLAATLILASYSPNLAIAEDRPSARTMIGLMPTVAVIASVALSRVPARRIFPTLHHQLPAVAALVGMLTAAAVYNVTAYFAVPASHELAMARQQVAAVGPVDHLTVRHTKWYWTLAPAVSYDEYGLPSTAFDDLARSVARLLYSEQFGSTPRVKVIDPGQSSPGRVADFTFGSP